ncbi:DODA-type extradiol aromatic ring-opening family dioxygenase [Methanosphaerula palustris]|uniref:Extradiol ring-cleavage dioxygenase class III protein subunit B n=1 Tax=Methanosphaerula palustris (strain ATCC BAA-1556 / DSM 19958 / E1-9c) TaxID=521011 RepID=B8GF38_METPE|nr:class III extradiol ring-cleavage dioxygenase [Methanosphaerula palustris]ACL17844.1 Extradiol ring-cleavage dioxygenase class III protein subunit B [Methanosphaerula palustris E1-9c]
MTSGRLPAIFVSHGAPTLPFEQIPARTFLQELGREYSDLSAVLCISAHWQTREPAVGTVLHPETIHDFSGFPDELYRIQYPATGSPPLADRVAGLLQGAGLPCRTDQTRGIDHGTWVPMMLMYPDARVPVVQLSIQQHLDPATHYAVGRALAPLQDEGVLIIGSGGAVHPLGYANLREGADPDPWAIAFNDWLNRAVTTGNHDALLHFQEQAPYPARAHPYPDHFMPLLTIAGTAGPGAKGTILHQSWDLGDLGMGAFAF